MSNVKQLKHLEHLEDEMLNYGVEGCKAAVSFLKELRKMLGHQESTGFMQTKWDGAPSHFVCMKPVLLSQPSILRSSFKKDTAALQP